MEGQPKNKNPLDTLKEVAGRAAEKVNDYLNEEQPVMTRRGFLTRVGGAAAAGIAAGYAGSELIDSLTQPHSQERGQHEQSELFSGEQQSFRELYTQLANNQILFVDEVGAPLGEPITLEPILRENQPPLSPGEFDEDGFVVGQINQAWLDSKRQQIRSRFPHAHLGTGSDSPRQMNVIQILRSARDYEARHGNRFVPLHFIDIVERYGEREVPGSGGKNHIEYVREFIGEHQDPRFPMDDTVVAELQRLVPGLAAQESQYNNDAQSSVGAFGIMQFMPATATRFGHTRAQMQGIQTQVETASLYFARIKNHIETQAHDSLRLIKREFFNDDTASFEKYFLVPVMINAYNAGEGRMVTVINTFARNFPNQERLTARIGSYTEGYGYDVYATMARLVGTADDNSPLEVSGYRRDSREYFSRTHALAEVLARPHSR